MDPSDDALPPVAAVFEVVFDHKIGYTISWKRSLPGIDLDGVEYQCLPSGLHGVKEDLVYFVHGETAGVSAFAQGKASEQQRNAHFVAIGALVPLRYGRLGKSWLYATELRRLAQDRLANGQDARGLELFWMKHRQDESQQTDGASSPTSTRQLPFSSAGSNTNLKRKRARSDVSNAFSAAHDPSADHPALSIQELIDTFGPLIFPLHRALLLRRRTLLIGTTPVQTTCNMIYLLSILSAIPQNVMESLQPDLHASQRIQTWFSVGVHDIPFLESSTAEQGWLACTTDDILGEKKTLYDVVMKLPSTQDLPVHKRWPHIQTADGKLVKATQRDLRRYRMLRAELDRTAVDQMPYSDHANASSNDDMSTSQSLVRASTTALLNEVKQQAPGEATVCEPVTWSAMAYNGFMWWASAGEMEAWENDEAHADRQLLQDIPETEALLQHIGDGPDDRDDVHLRMAEATVLTAYFHRITAQILEPLAGLVESADDDTIEGIAEAAIEVSHDDIRLMGLDAWSLADRQFVFDALQLYFDREARLQENGLQICGIRVC